MAQRFSVQSMVTLFTVVIVMLVGAASAGARSAPVPNEIIVCEYVVDPGRSGAGAWLRPDFDDRGRADGWFWANEHAWATPTIAWNPVSKVWVRHLAGSGGMWTYADKLVRTSARCQPL